MEIDVEAELRHRDTDFYPRLVDVVGCALKSADQLRPLAGNDSVIVEILFQDNVAVDRGRASVFPQLIDVADPSAAWA